jgi:hypothetical protein
MDSITAKVILDTTVAIARTNDIDPRLILSVLTKCLPSSPTARNAFKAVGWVHQIDSDRWATALAWWHYLITIHPVPPNWFLIGEMVQFYYDNSGGTASARPPPHAPHGMSEDVRLEGSWQRSTNVEYQCDLLETRFYGRSRWMAGYVYNRELASWVEQFNNEMTSVYAAAAGEPLFGPNAFASPFSS